MQVGLLWKELSSEISSHAERSEESHYLLLRFFSRFTTSE